VQTFLPYEDFQASAKVLDMKRLGKQRVETLQVLKALTTPDYGWQSHPAVKMWRGHLVTLLDYQVAICSEWTGRGYKDTCLEKSFALLDNYKGEVRVIKPAWLGNEQFHRSHQSNLIRKLPEHYSKFFIDVPDDLEYFWPEPISESQTLSESLEWKSLDQLGSSMSRKKTNV